MHDFMENLTQFILTGGVGNAIGIVSSELKGAQLLEKASEKLQQTESLLTQPALEPVPAGASAADFVNQKTTWTSPSGKEMTRAQAAKEAGITKAERTNMTNDELEHKLTEDGYVCNFERKYHIGEGPSSQVLTEQEMAEKLNMSVAELRQTPPSELYEKAGVTTIEPVGDSGRLPINCEWAGRYYPLKELHPKIYRQLCKEYPELADELAKGVRFTKEGYPDFSPFRVGQDYKFKNGFTGRTNDFRVADEARWGKGADGEAEREDLGVTWHHCEDGKTLQLIPTELHKSVRHTGGIAVTKGR